MQCALQASSFPCLTCIYAEFRIQTLRHPFLWWTFQRKANQCRSIVWRSICEGRDVLKLGVIRRIGDGKETQFFDNWLPRDHKLQPICERSATPPEFVSELINQAMHAWNIRSLLKLIFLLGDLLMCPSRRVMYDYLGTWRRRRLALSAMQLKIHGTIRSLIVAWRKQYGRWWMMMSWILFSRVIRRIDLFPYMIACWCSPLYMHKCMLRWLSCMLS